MRFKPIRRERIGPPRLGDAVERVAKPVARVLDRIFKTKLENCGGCQNRKEWLNGLG